MGGIRLKNTKVINLFGSPGAGKTTLAADIFVEMKRRGVSCELVTEFAKKAVWEKRGKALENEILLFAQKHHELFVLDGQVDYIIIDSPLLLTTIYNQIDGKVPNLNSLAKSEFNNYNNINIFLKNNSSPFEKEGRIHEGEIIVTINKMLTDLYYQISSFDTLFTTAGVNTKELVDDILGGNYK